MESYELVFKKSVAKDLRSIPKKDISRILKRIKVVREDPRGQGCVKLSVQERYRARQGVYRARMAPLRSPRPQRWSAHQHSPGLVCAHKHGAIEPATLAQPPECACAPRSKVCRTASVRAGLIGCSCPAAAARLQLPAYNCPPTTAMARPSTIDVRAAVVTGCIDSTFLAGQCVDVMPGTSAPPDVVGPP